MSSLIQCYAAIAGCIREKAKVDIKGGLKGHLSEIRF